MPAAPIEEAFRAKLVEVVGHSRVYPDQLPQKPKQWPCVVYQLAGGDIGATSLNGGRSRLRVARFTVEIYCPDTGAVASRKAAAGDREKAFNVFAGVACRGPWSGLFVTGALASEPAADADPLDLASEDVDRVERFTVAVHYRAGAD